MAAPAVAKREAGTTVERTKAVAYLRVSTPGQAEDGLGLQIQQDAISNYLKRNPMLELLRTYRDEGHSGSSVERPAIQELLNDAKHRGFKRVLVMNLSRFARSLYAQLFLERQLSACGVEVISLTESVNGSDPTVIAMRQMAGVFSELSRATIVATLASGRRKKIQMGQYAGGAPPMAYSARNAELVINPTEASIVRRILRARMGRRSYGWIARSLNNDGVRPKRGKRFYASSIRHIVRNPIYRGVIRYGTSVRGVHERIIP